MKPSRRGALALGIPICGVLRGDARAGRGQGAPSGTGPASWGVGVRRVRLPATIGEGDSCARNLLSIAATDGFAVSREAGALEVDPVPALAAVDERELDAARR